jgi:capsular exopolysaccharide synthesis family protein
MNMLGTLERPNPETPHGNSPGAGLLDLAGKAPVLTEREQPFLTQYLRMVMRRKWYIIGAIAAAVLISLVFTMLATPLYTAKTRVEIARSTDRIVKVDDVQRESTAADLEFYQTQYGLLKSRSLAERVVRDLRLQDNRAFFETFKAKLPANDPYSPRNRDERIRIAAFLLLKNVAISPERGSSLVDIEFTSPDPVLSTNIANSWARSFIQSNLDRRYQATAYARQFLETRLGQLRKRLEESERQAVGYAANQGLISIATPGTQGTTTSEQRSLIADKLARLNAELASATADRIRAESRVSANNGTASVEALASPALSGLRQRRTELVGEYAKMTVQFEPSYPPAVALQSQIRRLDAAIAAEEGRVGQTIRTAYSDAVEREQELSRRVEDLKAQFIQQQRRGIQYNIYQRDVDTTRQLYEALLQRYKEIGVAGGVGTNNVTIIDPAQVPGVPSSPNLMLNVLLALVLGSALGVGIALALEHVDEVISDPADVASALGAPMLGTVPKTEEDPQAALLDPKSSLTEAYLAIQTSLHFVTSHGLPTSLAVTSTGPAEGKSTTSAALARSIARSGRRVVLIDADMRSPSVHSLFGLDNAAGLSNILAGEDDFAKVMSREVMPNLSVITAGPPPPNAAELLSTDRFGWAVQRLAETFDHVIVDSPPVMGLADAPLIASGVEGTAYVIAAHGTRVSLIRMALQRMASSNAHLLGIVLTKFDAKQSSYGYGYDYGYGYAAARNKAKEQAA